MSRDAIMRILLTTAVILTIAVVLPATAEADWRWAEPTLEKHRVVYNCATTQCIKQSYKKALKRHNLRIKHYNQQRLREWTHWTRLFIPSCTWYGESGTGPEYSPARYVMWNSGGSGARGKFQMMDSTYHNRAKYHDWSALDQEIAARREYWANGTSPWTNC